MFRLTCTLPLLPTQWLVLRDKFLTPTVVSAALLPRLLGIRRGCARTRTRTRSGRDHRSPAGHVLQLAHRRLAVRLQCLQPAGLQRVLGVPGCLAVRVQECIRLHCLRSDRHHRDQKHHRIRTNLLRLPAHQSIDPTRNARDLLPKVDHRISTSRFILFILPSAHPWPSSSLVRIIRIRIHETQD